MNTATLLNPEYHLFQYCTLLPEDSRYIEHPIIQRFGSPNQPILIDQRQDQPPLILPLYNEKLQLVQCAVIIDEEMVQLTTDGEHSNIGPAKGFTYYGTLQKNKPIIVTFDLETYFKVSQTTYDVILVLLPNIGIYHKNQISSYDYQQIFFIIKLLIKEGFNKLYMPVRPEHLELNSSQLIQQNTGIKLLNQYQKNLTCDISQYDTADEVQEFLDKAIDSIQEVEWGEIVPLPSQNLVKKLDYPIETLPLLVREAIEAISAHVQAPIAMAAQCVFGAMSHIAQSQVNAPDYFKSQGEPCGLFLLTEGQSGSRKTTCRNLADRAIINHEHEIYEKYLIDLNLWQVQLASMGKKDKTAFIGQNPAPKDPITRFSDITLESLSGLYIDNVITDSSISSDEASQFFGGHTMKSDTRNQALGSYTKLFDEGVVERARSKSNLNGSGRAYDRRLTFNLQGQHEVLANALKDPVLLGQGFLARFILALPENIAGTRFQNESFQTNRVNNDIRLINFWKRCDDLIRDSHISIKNQIQFNRKVLKMNSEAKCLDLKFYNEIELSQAKGQAYEHLQPFASRANQLARRLATIIAFFVGHDEINSEVFSGACKVIKHSLQEWSRYKDLETPKENDTEKLLKYLLSKCQEGKTNLLHKTTSMKGGPATLRKSKVFDSCISELIELNYLRLISMNKTTYIEINPVLLN